METQRPWKKKMSRGPWKSLFFPLAIAELSSKNMVSILHPSHSPPPTHTHTHTDDVLDICSEESRDMGVGADSHAVSQEPEHLKRRSGRGRGVCSPGNGLSKGFIAFEYLTRHFFFIKICNLWFCFFFFFCIGQ